MSRTFLAVCGAILCGSTPGLAQGRPVVVQVRVVDSANAPVAGAAVAVTSGLSDLLGTGETDAGGSRTLRIVLDAESFQVTARKIGYGRASAFVTPRRDTVQVAITLRRAVQALDAVQVTAQEDVKRKAYHVDADEIANSTRPIFDGVDILTKLKPDILYGRMPGCGVREVFVNGKRIVFPAPNEMADARRGIKPDPHMRTQAGRPPKPPPLLSVSSDVVTIMSEIKPEHIEEMNYEDCFSSKVEGLHTSSALFVILKPGIGFEDGRGSYVIDAPANQGRAVGQAAHGAAATPAPVPAWRARLLGVFDGDTGVPVDSVSVTDSLSGTTARTTSTGTVSLLFLPEGPSVLHIARTGYIDQRLDVSISPRDTVPITLILTKKP